MPLSPLGGVQVTVDMPAFTVQNARDFDVGQAEYTFHILNVRGAREIASFTVPAGRSTTVGSPAGPLPRSLTLTWYVVANGPAGEMISSSASFRTVPVTCLPTRDPYAKAVIDWWVPACSLAQNHYNDPLQVLGPPDAGGHAPDSYNGFISLGEKGYVTVDMEACAVDQSGFDLRVFQSVSKEPVTVYASGSPNGPFVLLESRKPCGNVLSDVFSHYCDFDLESAGLTEARYFKIEDGEIYPCPGDTVTEGADIDAVEILNPKP